MVDAKILHAQKRWRGAMYMAGYSIECKLKAKLMEMHNLYTLEELENHVNRKADGEIRMFSHSIEILFELTGARRRLLSNPKRNPEVLLAYHECVSWSPAWRYDPSDGTAMECDTFMNAVGVFGKFIDGNV